jgi:hypothetical protein
MVPGITRPQGEKNMAIRIPTQSTAALTLALFLVSCAAPPIARLNLDSPSKAAASMDSAMDRLESARSTYREAYIDQLDREHGVSNVVIGAGALVTLLAAGKAGSDAILGVAAIGGATYAVGNLSLRRLRVQTYQAGVDALDCAQQAATPFNVPKAEIDALLARMGSLEISLTRLSIRLTEARRLRARLPAGSTETLMLDEAIATAASTQQAARNALDQGQQFVSAVSSAAGQLVATVDRIHSAVNKALTEATPDLSGIKAQLVAMPEMIGILAPSLRSRAESVLEKTNTAKARSAGGGTVAEQAAQALAEASLETALATDTVNQRVKARAVTGTPEAALKACKLARVITALAAEPASLSFSTGVFTEHAVSIQGGVPPYASRLEGPRIDGVTEKLSGNEVVVSVSGNVKGSHPLSLKISDLSQPPQVVQVAVTIAPPVAAASAPGAGTPAAPATAASATQAAAAIRQTNPFMHAGNEIAMSGVQVQGKVITVALLCSASDGKYTQDALSKSLLAQAGIAGTPKPAWSLKFSGACISG